MGVTLKGVVRSVGVKWCGFKKGMGLRSLGV